MVRWLPLESNPEVMNKFLLGMGVPSTVGMVDVYGLEPELLAMVPLPTHALLLLYPLTTTSEEFSKTQESSISSSGQEVSGDVYYMKQSVGNACGTVALMHAVANNTDKISLSDGALKSFLESTKSKSPEERGVALETDESITAVHEGCAAEGQTEAPPIDAKLDTHFVAFVNVGGSIYELDGRKKFPINHGSTTSETFLNDGAAVLRGFMERDSSESRFAVVALTDVE